jgi:hypothetical protein
MLTPIANYHHSKLPRAGAVGYITNGTDRYGSVLYWQGKKRKCIAESFALCDSPQYRGVYYSYGIHCVTVRFLDNGERARFSGFYFDEIV